MKPARWFVPFVAVVSVGAGCAIGPNLSGYSAVDGDVEWTISSNPGQVLEQGGGPARFVPFGSSAATSGTNSFTFTPTGGWVGDGGPWRLDVVIHPAPQCPYLIIDLCVGETYSDRYSMTLTTAAGVYPVAVDRSTYWEWPYGPDVPTADPSCPSGERNWMATGVIPVQELGGNFQLRWSWCSNLLDMIVTP
jgi:hypothetical protein